MRLAVKVCGLTREEDVEAALEAGFDAIGIVFDRGPCMIQDPVRATALLKAAGQRDVERIAVVGALPPARRQAIMALGFDVGQIQVGPDGWVSGPWLPAFFDEGDLADRILAWKAQRDQAAAADPGLRDEILRPPRTGRLLGTVNVDGKGGGGTGQRADWTRAAELARVVPLTLSGGLRTNNLEQAIRTVRPHALDVSSGVEAAPGKKSFAAMKTFIEEVRRVEALLDNEAGPS